MCNFTPYRFTNWVCIPSSPVKSEMLTNLAVRPPFLI
jgi:hypothetical protein